ncbi:MAG: hypothetical protein GC204_09055 [Chloroflexi bacterium]|nr:hypothetical protein [Chloroflexota bacterium]
MKTNHFYGLRLIKLIYNMLCLLVVITCLGGLGFISLQALNAEGASYTRFATWLPQALGLIIGGGLLALTFYVIAQVIEVQLSVNAKMNHILKVIEDVPSVQDFEAINKKTLDELAKVQTELQNQSRLIRLQNSSTTQSTPQSTTTASTRTLPNTKAIP